MSLRHSVTLPRRIYFCQSAQLCFSYSNLPVELPFSSAVKDLDLYLNTSSYLLFVFFPICCFHRLPLDCVLWSSPIEREMRLKSLGMLKARIAQTDLILLHFSESNSPTLDSLLLSQYLTHTWTQCIAVRPGSPLIYCRIFTFP